jgi:chemotaxis protein methyltransferase CheR
MVRAILEKKEYDIVLAESSVTRLRSLITDRSNVNINIYKDEYLGRRLKVRMRAIQHKSPEMYLNFVERNPDEYKKLVSVLTIKVTSFFRNKQTFRKISEIVVPVICQDKIERGEKKINVLCVGCATGEEPYSIAMIFLEQFQKAGRNLKLKVIGTDVDKKALFTAVKGVYSPDKISKIPKRHLQKYFTVVKNGFQVTADLKSSVIFLKKDVFTHRVYSRFDFIMCRNLLIYFLRSYQEDIQEGFYKQLLPGGFLVLGRTESLVGKGRQLFEAISIPDRVYRKMSK